MTMSWLADRKATTTAASAVATGSTRGGRSALIGRSHATLLPLDVISGEESPQSINTKLPNRGNVGMQPLFRLLGIRGDLHLHDLVRVRDRAVAGLVALFDLIDVFHARGHLPPNRVLAVEGRGRREHDEELAVGAVRIGGARHRCGAANMFFAGELGFQLMPGTAGAGAGRIAGLGHKAVDHAVERPAIVKTAR